jgi:diguanylate cyclase (GGDEF)-like protein/excisionase family DNA binding protein
VTKAARLLGVHPNTIRAWSDQGRLRYYRINSRGDRRYRLNDLERFMSAGAAGPAEIAAPFAVPPGRGRPTSGVAPGVRRLPMRELVLAPPPFDLERHRLELSVLGDLARRAARERNLDTVLAEAVQVVHHDLGYLAVGVWQLRGRILVARSTAGPIRGGDLPAGNGVMGRALAGNEPALGSPRAGEVAMTSGAQGELAVPIPVGSTTWGALYLAVDEPGGPSERDVALARAIADLLASAVAAAHLAEEAAHELHRAEALARVVTDLGGRLDVNRLLAGLVDHAQVLFEADRAAVFLRRRDGHIEAEASRGLSPAYLAAVRDLPDGSLPSAAAAAGRPLAAVGYRDDPRGQSVRSAVVQEGFDTICSAPLLDGSVLVGLLDVYHDRPYAWSDEELETIAALAAQASVAIKTAQAYRQMEAWAAQLQSIQQLGARLNRLTDETEIALAIATELRQAIDYHNVRVYRIEGQDLRPLAVKGQLGEYVDQTPEQLRLRVGEGITGWVARHGLAQYLPDAARDPRAKTIPGTQEDLAESMLLAPMVFEDACLGVVVLSKLGLHQFAEDDLRLLVIYASFAAQAFAHADATARLRRQSDALERQLQSRRDLLGITESILTTLDPRAVLDQIADRLSALVGYDSISIEVYDRSTRTLRPLKATGVHGHDRLQELDAGERGLATWVIERNEPVLVLDQYDDDRVRHIEPAGRAHGSLIVVPLRGRDGVTGVLTVERLGEGNVYTDDEFELVKLFAAHVSIALQNAEVHRAVEIRAQTDDLTGLLNDGTFREWLARSVAGREAFSLLMLDLDDFKSVNDTLGHQAGDRFLREVANAVVRAGRDSDLVFRYGGDEFALILPRTDADGAHEVAGRVRAAIDGVGGPGSAWAAEAIEVSASIGVASYPADGSSPEEVLLAADRACFVAKRTGPGLIATAAEGLALAAEFTLSEPTPVDAPTIEVG